MLCQTSIKREQYVSAAFLSSSKNEVEKSIPPRLLFLLGRGPFHIRLTKTSWWWIVIIFIIITWRFLSQRWCRVLVLHRSWSAVFMMNIINIIEHVLRPFLGRKERWAVLLLDPEKIWGRQGWTVTTLPFWISLLESCSLHQECLLV